MHAYIEDPLELLSAWRVLSLFRDDLRTVLLLLRLRFHIVTITRDGERNLLAEDALIRAFTRDPSPAMAVRFRSRKADRPQARRQRPNSYSTSLLQSTSCRSHGAPATTAQWSPRPSNAQPTPKATGKIIIARDSTAYQPPAAPTPDTRPLKQREHDQRVRDQNQRDNDILLGR